jgi:hypothetical protein
MHEAALKADEDPDQLSFLHAVRVIRRNCREVKRKMNNFQLRLRHLKPLPKINIREAIRILK